MITITHAPHPKLRYAKITTEKTIETAITKYPREVGEFLWEDMKDRPFYYIGGVGLAPAVGTVSKIAGGSVSALSGFKIDGAIKSLINNPINSYTGCY